MNRPLFALLIAFACPGCFLAPGMKMDEAALHERGRGSVDPSKFKVMVITPELLALQARQVADAERARHNRPPPPPAPSYQYRISPHDVLSVIVWEHPELTIPAGEFRSAEATGYIVAPDGTIFFPHVGTLEVSGKTTEDVRHLLTEKLAQFVRDPQLQVLVVGYRGKRVQVAGEVMLPTSVPITDVPLRVQDAVAQAKGFTLEADPAHVILTRNGQTHPLDLMALYEGGDTSQNWVLEDGDIVHVPDRSRNKVFVLGEVKKPSSKIMVRGRMTLADALGDSEGLDLAAANPSQIMVFRGQYDAPEIYRLDASSPDALLLATQFQLRPHDVVYVATYELTRFNRVVSQIYPTIQALTNSLTDYVIIRRN